MYTYVLANTFYVHHCYISFSPSTHLQTQSPGGVPAKNIFTNNNEYEANTVDSKELEQRQLGN